MKRRALLAGAGAAAATPFFNSWAGLTSRETANEKMVLSNFNSGYVRPGVAWQGFSDRVMGGVSTAKLDTAFIDGKQCVRLSGNVTRENNGGFIQLALIFGRNYAELNASGYKGVEALVYGNNERYNIHVRTPDCDWYDQSYRMTFFAEPQWQRIRVPWEAFEGNRVSEPLDNSRLVRLAVLGWMREFDADIALAEISLYS